MEREESQKLIRFSAIGLDQPGLVSKITTKVYEMNGNIMRMEEHNREGLFTIFMLVDFTQSENSIDDIKEALKKLEGESNLKVVLSPHQLATRDLPFTPENHVITILGGDKPGIIANISTLFQKYNVNIERIETIASGQFFSMEMMINTSTLNIKDEALYKSTIKQMLQELKQLCAELKQSVVIQTEEMFGKMKKLIIFDAETSLIEASSIDAYFKKIAEEIGNESFIFETLKENVSSLEGLSYTILRGFRKILRLRNGTIQLITILRSMGYKIALISAGLNSFIKRIIEEVKVDYAFSNSLKIDENGRFTGEFDEPLITQETKAHIVELILNLEKIKRENIIAVGDGSSQCEFMHDAGLSIAYNAKRLDLKSNGVLESDSVLHLLYCLGLPKTEIDHYIEKST